MPATVSAQHICPHCGAKVDALWTSCWMCGLDLPVEEQTARPSVPQAPAEPSFVTRAAGFVPWLLGGLIVLMLIGLCANGDWGAAGGLVLLLTPPSVYTINKSILRQDNNETVAKLGHGPATKAPMTGAATLGTFLVSLAVTIGCVFAVGVAAFIALFVICIASLSNTNWH